VGNIVPHADFLQSHRNRMKEKSKKEKR